LNARKEAWGVSGRGSQVSALKQMGGFLQRHGWYF